MEQSERLEQIKAALVDFLLRAHEIPHLEKVVLFGSVIEGDVNKKSDIDLLLIFDTTNNPETGIELETAIKVGLRVLQTYTIENNFSFVVVNTQNPSDTDKDFLTNIASKGVIVWGKRGFDLLKKHREISAKTLFIYSTQNLSPANKRKLLRKVAQTVKLHGEKLGGGVVLIENKWEKETEEIFQECQAAYEKQEVFT
jgi:predicted nucleotidyltransferase